MIGKPFYSSFFNIQHVRQLINVQQYLFTTDINSVPKLILRHSPILIPKIIAYKLNKMWEKVWTQTHTKRINCSKNSKTSKIWLKWNYACDCISTFVLFKSITLPNIMGSLLPTSCGVMINPDVRNSVTRMCSRGMLTVSMTTDETARKLA